MMHVIVCLDERNGMSFNHRRLSADREVSNRIRVLAAQKRLWMSPYSARLFVDTAILTDESFLIKAQNGDVCFVEREDILPHLDRIQTVTVFCWNRAYPSDRKFPMDRLDTWQKHYVGDFPGNSHEKITEWRYTR